MLALSRRTGDRIRIQGSTGVLVWITVEKIKRNRRNMTWGADISFEADGKKTVKQMRSGVSEEVPGVERTTLTLVQISGARIVMSFSSPEDTTILREELLGDDPD
jgi:sRNA-binding carbon storage regulator CsrA